MRYINPMNNDDKEYVYKILLHICKESNQSLFIGGRWLYIGGTLDMNSAVTEFINEFQPYINIKRNTTIESRGYIYPIQNDIKCIDISKLPLSWKMIGFPYLYVTGIKYNKYWYENGKIYGLDKKFTPSKNMYFKAYISSYLDDYIIYPLQTKECSLCKIYGSIVPNYIPKNKFIGSVSIFEHITNSYIDIKMIFKI